MGIINALLTGGVLIGKICQAVGGGLGKTYTDEASGVTVSGDVSSGGVKFFRSDASGQSMVYAFNPDTSSSAAVTVPNESDSSGVTYIIPPTQKIPFAEADSPLVSPLVNVTTGLTGSSTALAGVDVIKPLFKLAFSGLKIGSWVNVGSFRLSCTTTQLLIVSSQITASALTYMWLSSNKGVSASNQNPIPPEKTNILQASAAEGADVETEQTFDIDFKSLGFDMNTDILEGQITLEVAGTAQDLVKLCKVASEPLHPAEQEFFARLANGKL